MPHLSAHLFDSAEERRDRVQGYAGTSPALHHTINPGCLHSSHYAREADCTGRSHVVGFLFSVTLAPILGEMLLNIEARFNLAGETGCKPGAKLTQFAPNFAEFLAPNHSVSLFECMAGTTGLEPATSAVTANQKRVTHWNQA